MVWVDKPIKEPESAAEVSSMLQEANRRTDRVIPWGSGTHQQIGYPPSEADFLLSFRKLNRIISFSPQDLTVTVESGITLDELQKFIHPHHQFFPFWEPECEQRTLGGILSTASSNHLAPRYFQLRDLVLGIAVCQADGKLIKGGGQVVKNVSGYEMPKLFIGAFGTLGCITSMTLRLSPLPVRTLLMKTKLTNVQQGFRLLSGFFGSKLVLSFAFLSKSPNGIFLLLRLDGGDLFIQDQSKKIKRILHEEDLKTETASFEEALRILFIQAYSITCKGSVPPSSFPVLYQKIEDLSSRHSLESAWIFSMDGMFRLGWQGGSCKLLLPQIREFNRQVSGTGGWISYEKIPEECGRDWPWWGEERKELELCRKIKSLFDPKEILNPGRYIQQGRNAGS